MVQNAPKPHLQRGKPPSTMKTQVSGVDTSLALSITAWLKKHGKVIHPPLSANSKRQLKECFELMDADGSGAIDAEELYAAFKLLGLDMKKAEVTALLEEVDKDGSGEVDYHEFLQIIATTIGRTEEAEEDSEKKSIKPDSQMSFSLMATAYRRKRLMEGLISRDKGVQEQIARMAEELDAFEKAGLVPTLQSNCSVSELEDCKDAECVNSTENSDAEKAGGVRSLIPKRIEESKLKKATSVQHKSHNSKIKERKVAKVSPERTLSHQQAKEHSHLSLISGMKYWDNNHSQLSMYETNFWETVSTGESEDSSEIVCFSACQALSDIRHNALRRKTLLLNFPMSFNT